MPDVRVVLGLVRRQLERVTGRLEHLDRDRADLQRESEQLAGAIHVMEQHAGEAARPSSSDESPGAQPLAERILDAVVSGSAVRRSDLLRLFTPGVNANTLDSALRRLTQRGLVERRGRRLVPVPSTGSGSAVDRPAADPGALSVEVDPGRVGHPAAAAVVEDASGGTALATPPVPSDDLPLTVRVLEAVGTSNVCNRRDLVQHFAVHGVKEAAVDVALAGLRRRRKLERQPDGTLVVPRSDAPSVAADGAPEGPSQAS